MSFSREVRLAFLAVLLVCAWPAAQLCGADSARLAPGEHDTPVNDVQLHYTIAGHGPLVFVCSPGWVLVLSTCSAAWLLWRGVSR